MTILLLGATGRTGKLVLEAAINKGYRANCILRKHPVHTVHGVNFFIGSPTDKELLKQAMEGCDAIVNILNISRTSDFPWAKLRTPEKFLSEIMHNILLLTKESPIQRIVVCSAWGVAETRTHIPSWFRWLIDNSNIGVAYADHERQEKILQQSDLKWTIVRPAALLNTRKNQHVIESYSNEPKPRLTISRLSVAKYLVDALSNDSLIRKTPVISA